MHDVQLHFGDLRKSWGRHSPEAVGLLFNLLCEYYDREAPLPADAETLEDLAGAETKPQKALLPKLLKRHLQLIETPAGPVWKWARCDLEIARYKHRCAVNAHNNLLKFVGKSSGRLKAPPFEEFAAHIEHYRDPVSGRFRNLGEPVPPGINGSPKVSESETVAPRKVPASGDHSPTLPLSHSPTSPESSAVAGDLPKPPAVHVQSIAESIYALYPRKVGKLNAIKAILKALKTSNLSVPEMAAKVRAYAEAVKGQDKTFIPHPATWFNAGRYMDDPAEWRDGTTHSGTGFDRQKKRGGGGWRR